MPDLARHFAVRLLALTMLAAILLAGCGGDDAVIRTVATTPEPSARNRALTTPTQDDDDGDDVVVTPTPAARAAGARYQALVAAYARVTTRINFLVTAETLRADAVASGAGEAVELERFGAVRIELQRMHRILRQARPKVADVHVATESEEHVQGLMLEAIDARLRALRELKLALVAHGSTDTPATEAERLDERWRASWNESLRAAREATTSMQEARAMLGLEPAAEDGIR